jgi:uncharacterized membrane protein
MSPLHQSLTAEPQSPLAQVVERNIDALLARRQAERAARGANERIADRVARFAGSMTFVLIHIVLFGTWIVWNVGWLPLAPFDPQFTVLGMTASVEAIFLSTFVLITQNRMQEQADTRADLDLQVSLLAEHEVTRLITLTVAIAQRMGIEEANDPELAELARDVQPEKVLDEIEHNTRRFAEAESAAGNGAAHRD